ncbi:MAG: hypothetical protein EOP84_13275 [Verrucomicrobiaceae bacterium]|nr:MAG: hypothetical protein EOP84_13275 [Verrucomicrobiaceae bacterium]
MSHRVLTQVALESLRQALDTIFEDESLRSSPRFIELTKNAQFFLGQVGEELQGLIKEYDHLKATLDPVPGDERR